MTDLTHSSAAMLQPPGPYVPLPVANLAERAILLLNDAGHTYMAQEVGEQLNELIAALADSGLLIWASPILYFNSECGFSQNGNNYRQDVSSFRVSDSSGDLAARGIAVPQPWRRAIYNGDPIGEFFDGVTMTYRQGYAWRYFNHFGIDIYDASGGRGVYGLFDGFSPGNTPVYDGIVPIDISNAVITDTTLTVTWDVSSNPTAIKLALYLKQGTNAGTDISGALVDMSAGQYTFTGLSPMTGYTVICYALTRFNESTITTEASSTTLAGPPPAPDVLALGTSVGIDISWIEVPDAATYNIYFNGVLDTSGLVYADSPLTRVGLSPGLYSVQMSSVNALGEGPLSTAQDVYVLLPPPTELQIDTLGTIDTHISWLSVTGAAYYNIYLDGIFDMSGGNKLPRSSALLMGLTASTPYTVTVRTVDQFGNESGDSAPLSFTTNGGSVPTVPKNIEPSNVYSTGFTVSWAASDASGYKLYRYEGGSSTILEVVQDVLGTSYTFTGLPPPPTALGSQQWDVRVSAYNAAGESALSDPPLMVDTTNIPECPSITDRSTVFNGFTVTWNDLSWNPDINGILVRLDGIAQFPVGAGDPTISKATTSATFENIPAGTYALTVISFNELNGTHIECDALVPITPETLVISDAVPIDAPTGVQITNAFSTGFKISWGLVTNAAAYDIYIDSSDFPYPRTYTTTATIFTVSDLPSPTFGSTKDYSVWVKARAGTVVSNQSITVTGTVTHAPPMITGFVVVGVSETGFEISWNPLDNPNVKSIDIDLSGNLISSLLPTLTSAAFSNIARKADPYLVSVRTKNYENANTISSYPVSQEIYIPPRPLQPTGVVYAYDPTGPNIILNWETAQGAKYYRFVFDGSYHINGGMYVDPYFPPVPDADAQAYTFASMYPPSKLFTLGIEPYNDMSVMGPASDSLEIAAYPGPLGLIVRSTTQDSITIQWASTTENNATYTLRLYDENDNPLDTIHNEPGPAYTFTSLASNTTYKIGVTPSNDYGTGTEAIVTVTIYSGPGFARKFFSGEPLAAGTAASTVFASVETGTATTIQGVSGVDGWIVDYNATEVKGTWFVQFNITWATPTQRILLATNADDGFLVRYRENGTIPWTIVCDSWKMYPGNGLGGKPRYTLPFTLEQGKTYEFQVVNCNYMGYTQCKITAFAAPTEPIVVSNPSDPTLDGTYTFAPPGTAGSVYNAGTPPYAYDSAVLDSLTLTEVIFSQYMVTP